MSEKALLRLADALGIQFGTADEIVDAALKRIGAPPKFKKGECVLVSQIDSDFHGKVGVVTDIEIANGERYYTVSIEIIQWLRECDLEKVQ